VKPCANCKKDFEPDSRNCKRQKFCSRKCKYSFLPRKRKLFEGAFRSSTVGTIQEYRVIADLMIKGYFVYVQTDDGPFDLVAYKSGKLLKVEVRSVRIAPNGKEYWPKDGDYDIMAVVDQFGSIRYFPEVV
jgi:hypothetical protein